jgi:hypothetical protein
VCILLGPSLFRPEDLLKFSLLPLPGRPGMAPSVKGHACVFSPLTGTLPPAMGVVSLKLCRKRK